MNTMTAAPMDSTISADGTPIAYWRSGRGDPLVVVHGTTADHTRWRTVLSLLEAHATVCAVDRRGRGGSGDADGYAITREFADVAAVVDAVAEACGGPVDLLGHSYGGVCALEAVLLTANVRRLVLYEPPVLAEPGPPGMAARLQGLLADGRREEVVATFFREVAGVGDRELQILRSLPSWPARVAAAHTLPRELRSEDGYAFEPARFAAVAVPTLLLAGGDSPPFFQASTEAVAAALPDSRVTVLPGQAHIAMDTAPELFAGAVTAFLYES
jgi:pimeloyl-ACP methyl ester carboxylesterase